MNEIQKAYAILNDVTPLRVDCGKLCDGLCCKGTDGDGMLLLPGEEDYVDTENGKIMYTPIGNLYVCSGKCNRSKRPYACRIFPYFPYITKKEGKSDEYEVRVRPDIRAKICPVIRNSENIIPNRKFIPAVTVSAKILIQNEEIREYLKFISDDLSGTAEKFFGIK